MIGDVLTEAISEIRSYQQDFPDVYGKFGEKIDTLLKKMTELQIELNTLQETSEK